MHPYIPHLLEDIAAGHQTERSEACPLESPDLAGVIGEFERIKQEPGHTLGYYSGLKAEGFPPAERLNNKEMMDVCRALKKMMLTWKLKYHFPKGLPVRMMYALLIKALERRIDPQSFFSVEFAYCSGSTKDCPLEKYCSCLKREGQKISSSGRNDEGKNGGFIQIKGL
jgi:hypothetical protein